MRRRFVELTICVISCYVSAVVFAQRYTFQAQTTVARILLDRDTYHSHSRARKLSVSTRSDDRAGSWRNDGRTWPLMFSPKNAAHPVFENIVVRMSDIELSCLTFLRVVMFLYLPEYFRNRVRTNAVALTSPLYRKKRAIERGEEYKPIMRPVSRRGNRISKHVRR